MTVLFAFCSPSRRHSAICADDLDVNNGDRADKVMVAFERYGIGFVGPGFLMTAAERVLAEASRAPDSVMLLCHEIYRRAPQLAHEENAGLELALQRDPTKEEQAKRWRSQTGALVVLDAHNHQLYYARAKQTVAALLARPADEAPEFSVRRLGAEQLYEIAACVSDREPIPDDAFSDHRGWVEREITRAAKCINGREGYRAVGDIGTSVEAKDKKLALWSAFDSAEEFLDARGDCLGCRT